MRSRLLQIKLEVTSFIAIFQYHMTGVLSYFHRVLSAGYIMSLFLVKLIKECLVYGGLCSASIARR